MVELTRQPALNRVREIANELARSHPNAKHLVRELFIAFTAVHEEIRQSVESENAATALRIIRDAVERGAPGALPSSSTVRMFYGPGPEGEAQAIAEALRELLPGEDRSETITLPSWGELKARKRAETPSGVSPASHHT
jgi:hypothetical protein